MKKIYTEEQRNEILQHYRSGEKVASICEDTGIAKSTIYEWTKSNNKKKSTITTSKVGIQQTVSCARKQDFPIRYYSNFFSTFVAPIEEPKQFN